MATFNGKVTGGGLNLRTTANTNASSPVQIPNGTSISVSTINGNQEWFSTSYGGYSGYVVAQYVAITSDGGTCTVTTSSGSLNIRKKASTGANVVYTAAKGSTLRLLDSTSVSGWYRVSNASGTGWGSSSYLTVDSNPGGDNTGTGGNDYSIQTTIDTVKHGTGGTVKLRVAASKSSDIVVNIPDRSTIYVKSLSGAWIAAKYNNYTGYIMAEFVVGSNVYNSSTGDNSGTTTYTFNASNSVTYAMNHSDNTTGVACPKRNTTFSDIDGNDDCADFVSQCLCAGGVPMFDGWFYSISGIPSSWKNSKWGVTYSGYQKLNGKGWLETVSYNAIEPGDIIYTYQADATPTPYTHVTIAVSNNVTEGGKFGCRVCGYTTNQHDRFKPLSASNCRCYRVKKTFTGNGSEKRVSLPLSGNGATVL